MFPDLCRVLYIPSHYLLYYLFIIHTKYLLSCRKPITGSKSSWLNITNYNHLKSYHGKNIKHN